MTLSTTQFGDHTIPAIHHTLKTIKEISRSFLKEVYDFKNAIIFT